MEQSRAAIDSLYKHDGYYNAQIKTLELPQDNGRVRVVFDVDEGQRVAISQVVVDGNRRFYGQAGREAHGHAARGLLVVPEGRVRRAQGGPGRARAAAALVRRQRLRRLPGDARLARGRLARAGKAVLHLTVDEGQAYQVGTFDIEGNRRFSTEELQAYYPFGPVGPDRCAGGRAAAVQPRPTGTRPRKRSRTSTPTTATSTPRSSRPRPGAPAADGKPIIDLRWTIREGSPATINKVEIVGNDVTHERVIREAIVMLPGDLFSRDRLIRSYQNVSNLGFFQQPLPSPDVKPSANGVDVDIIFRVEERRTGNINFGASLGQGTGVGGFLGLEEPNLFGRGKRGKLQWQFGKNINDFTLSYTDPAIRESRISGTVSLFDSPRPVHHRRPGPAQADRRQRPARLPVPGLALHPVLYLVLLPARAVHRRLGRPPRPVQLQRLQPLHRRHQRAAGHPDRAPVRHWRLLHQRERRAQRRVPGWDRRITGRWTSRAAGTPRSARWAAPGSSAAGVQFVLGLTAKSGFIFGDAGPFFTELYSLGGVQYGVPLRGYDEFSITPNGFDPSASGNQASPDAFGKSYAAFTVEAGARISQSLYRRARSSTPATSTGARGSGIRRGSSAGPASARR